MTVDEWTKVILVGAIAFAIILISIGIFKVLNNLADGISDGRKAIRNAVKLSDMTLEDYIYIRRNIKDLFASFKNAFEPFKFLNNLIEFVRNLKKERPKELKD